MDRRRGTSIPRAWRCNEQVTTVPTVGALLMLLIRLPASWMRRCRWRFTKHVERAPGSGKRLNALQNAAFQLCGVSISSETSASVSIAVNDDGMKLVEQINDRIRVATGGAASAATNWLPSPVTATDVRAQFGLSTGCRGGTAPSEQCSTLHWMRCTCTAPAVVASSAAVVAWFGVAWTVDYDLIRNLQERFRARIEELLVQGRRFAVLDRRAHRRSTNGRSGCSESADVDPERSGAPRQGVSVRRLPAVREQSTVSRCTEERKTDRSLPARPVREVLATVRVRFSVLAVATRQVEWSRHWSCNMDSRQRSFRPEQAGGTTAGLSSRVHIVGRVDGVHLPARGDTGDRDGGASW